MEPLTGIQASVGALTIIEKMTKFYRDWTGKLPDGPAKDQASKDLECGREPAIGKDRTRKRSRLQTLPTALPTWHPVGHTGRCFPALEM